jgi:FMN phosphatase YigB (HAD superfamily)
MRVLAFDVYGTLVDVHGLQEVVQPFPGAAAPSFLVRWREKTVEYAFRRGLMENYVELRNPQVSGRSGSAGIRIKYLIRGVLSLTLS